MTSRALTRLHKEKTRRVAARKDNANKGNQLENEGGITIASCA
jgi:hypothetical protein